MIDEEGYRANVGIIVINNLNQVFWAKRIGQEAWQFPQGGVQAGESAENALFRELYEEVGLRPKHVDILASTDEWLKYRLPRRLIREKDAQVCIGQKQKWFLLKYKGESNDFSFDHSPEPEFDGWCWVPYWYPVRYVVSFKRDVYRRALMEFRTTVWGTGSPQALDAFSGT